jgi:membrane associated rhomboid family serine protease
MLSHFSRGQNRVGVRAWWGVGALLGLGTLLVGMMPSTSLQTQTALVWQSDTPFSWTCWTAAWVHLSFAHEVLNLLALTLLLVLAWYWALPVAAALAWLLAWPLSIASLTFWPEVHRYAGLSGVIHAGWTIACVFMPRWVWQNKDATLVVLAGLLLKGGLEIVSKPPIEMSAAWGFSVAYCAHSMGIMVGLVTGCLARRGRLKK